MIPAGINDIFWRTEVTLTSSYGGAPYDCRQALHLIAAGAVPVERTVTHRLSMKAGAFAFQLVSDPVRNECVKVIVEPGKSEKGGPHVQGF